MQLGEGLRRRVLQRVRTDGDRHARQRALDEKPVASNVLPGAQRHQRLFTLAGYDAQAVALTERGVFLRCEPLHRGGAAVFGGARVGVMLAQPAERTACPEMVEPLTAGRVRDLKVGAVAGEEAARAERA